MRGIRLRRLGLLAVGLCLALAAIQSIASADPRQTDLLSLGPTGGNGTFDASYKAASQDGSTIFFTTSEKLAAGDTDTAEDLYMRAFGVTTLLSVGPAGGNSSLDNAIFDGNSADGTYVFFSTTEALTSSDTDAMLDAYQWHNGVVTLVTIGPTGGNGAVDAFYLDNSDDGTKIWFDTTEKLTSDDTDGFQDVFLSSSGTTSRISQGPTGGNGSLHSFYLDHSADGSHTLFQTGESLVSGDSDGGYQDIYDRSGGTTTLVSTGPVGGNGAFDASYGAATPDVSHIVFSTSEVLASGDTDTRRDLYDRSGGTTTRVSTGPSGGNGAYNAFFEGVSDDGSKVWFTSREPLVASDTDGGCLDALGNPVLTCTDVYEREGATTNLVSCCGNGSAEAFFLSASQDGSKVFFRTPEALTADDADGTFQDIYQRSAGTTTLISTGPTGGNGPHDAFFGGISADGARVFFQTNDPMVSSDTDGGYQDVYERYGGTTLVSTGPTTTNSASLASFGGASQDGTKVFFETGEALTSADTDSSRDVYGSTQTAPGYPRTKGATPLIFALVPAYQSCTSGNSTHGAPLSYASCAPPVQDSGVLTQGSPDANGHAAASISQLKLKPIVGAAGPPDDSNLAVIMNVNDVLCRAANAACGGGALSDYAGKLLVKFNLRLTDKYNGSPLAEAATMQDFDVQIPLQCAATASTSEGGRCQVTTMVNALFPGAVRDTKRATWAVDRMRVLDAGPNGTGFGSGCPSTCGDGDETEFMRPGVFVP
jgi:hypothetical protein